MRTLLNTEARHVCGGNGPSLGTRAGNVVVVGGATNLLYLMLCAGGLALVYVGYHRVMDPFFQSHATPS